MIRISTSQLISRFLILFTTAFMFLLKIGQVFGLISKTYQYSDNIAVVFAFVFLLLFTVILIKTMKIIKYGLIQIKDETVIVRLGLRSMTLNLKTIKFGLSDNGKKLIVTGEKKFEVPLSGLNKSDLNVFLENSNHQINRTEYTAAT